MNNKNRTITLVSITVIAVMLTTSVVWLQDDMNNPATPITAADNETTEDNDDKFFMPPPVGTEAHDEWLEWYRTAELGILESKARDHVLIAHDFEEKFHPDTDHDVSLEVVALLAQKARLLDDYDAVETEKRLHDWAIENYDPPKTIKEIDAALLAIIQTKDNLHHAETVYAALTEASTLGHVPKSLWELDWEYWTWERHISACKLEWDDCDPVQMRADLALNRELTAEEIEEIEKYLEQGDYLGTVDAVEYEQGNPFPTAYAADVIPKHNNVYLNVWANSCTLSSEFGCNYSDFDGGVGWNRVSESSTNYHNAQGDSPHTSSTIHYTVSASASYSSGAISQSVYANGEFTHPDDSQYQSDGGTTSAAIQANWNPPGTNHSFGAKGKSYASATFN